MSRTILVIEDNAQNLYLMRFLLEREGYVVIAAIDGPSGIDMALRVVELLADTIAAEAAQLMIEYDPQPKFDSGSMPKASEAVIARVIEYAQLRQ